MEKNTNSPPLIIPLGTQVVLSREIPGPKNKPICQRGAVGEVIKAPGDGRHSYRLRLVDGREISVKRKDITIRKLHQRDRSQLQLDVKTEELTNFVIYRCVVGSRAYGLNHDESDVDVRGIYLPPAHLHWSLYGVPPQLEFEEREECFWELEKFINLALKANPNILECLYTPLFQEASPIAQELLDEREHFLSRLVFQTYNGYVMSQFKKLEQDLRTRGAIRWKHAMHLIRLLLSGITVLKDGFVPVDVGQHRDRLLTIRYGKLPWEEIDEWRLSLHKEFDEAFAKTKLPERPDYEWANDFLIKARRLQVKD